jgi:transposase
LPCGFRDLSAWLLRFGATTAFACMEATGRYGNKLASYLYAGGHKVAVINPAFIASHKSTLNKHNKTDPVDSEAIADYARCFAARLRLWQPKSQAHQALVDVVGQIELLKKTATAFSNRAVSGIETKEVQASIEKILGHIQSELRDLEAVRDRLFDELPVLREVREIVDSVPGIGKVSADSLAARIDFANFRNGRDLAAFLGLGPREWQSGKQKRRGKTTKAGDKHIRANLRMGAMSATYQKNSYYREFAERLRNRGLEEKQIINAVAHKMILIAHALVRKRQLFDCCYEHTLNAA